MAACDLRAREPRAARATQPSRRALVTALALGLALLAAARDASPAQLKSLQSGTTTVTTLPVTVLLPTRVDPTKAFLVFSVSEASTQPADAQVSGVLTATAVTFQHITGTTGSATIKYYVAEFWSGVSVQRGSADLTVGSPVNVTLSPAVNAAKSFPLISYQVTGTDFDSNDLVRAKITSATSLQLSYAGPAAAAPQVLEWQVVEYQDAKVQTGDVTFLTTDPSKTVSLASSVNTAKSWLIFNYECDAAGCPGPDANIGNKMVRGVITNTNTLTFDRNNTGKGLILTWYLVEFTDDTTVQSGSQNFAATDTQKDITISTVPVGRSLAAAGGYMRGGRTPLSTSANPGVAWFTLDLTTSTNLQITRGASSDAADVGWFVVTFAPVALYRSVGITATDLNTAPRTVTIAGTTATFSGSMPDKVGVGDVLQYQVAATYYVAFIYGRTSSTVYTVASATGGVPQAAVAGTAVSVYRAYTSLFNWEARSENGTINAAVRDFDTGATADLVTADRVMNAACYGDGDDTTQTTINGWTTDATHYIRIYTPYLPSEVGVSQRHKGVWDATKYVIRSTYAPIDIGDSFAGTNSVWIDGLQIWLNSVTSNGNSGIITNQTGAANHRFSNNIIRGDSGAGNFDSYGIQFYYAAAGSVARIWNNIVYDFTRSSRGYGIGVGGAPTRSRATSTTTRSTTATTASTGRANGTFVAKNNVYRSAGLAGTPDGFGGTFAASLGLQQLGQVRRCARHRAKSEHELTLVLRGDRRREHLRLGRGKPEGSPSAGRRDLHERRSRSLLPTRTWRSRPTSTFRPGRSGRWDIGADEYRSAGSLPVGGHHRHRPEHERPHRGDRRQHRDLLRLHAGERRRGRRPPVPGGGDLLPGLHQRTDLRHRLHRPVVDGGDAPGARPRARP